MARLVDDADDDDDDAGVEAAAVAAKWIALTPKGCEPDAHDLVASNHKNFVFAGRDSERRYQFICKHCNYGDLQPFARAHRNVAFALTAALTPTITATAIAATVAFPTLTTTLAATSKPAALAAALAAALTALALAAPVATTSPPRQPVGALQMIFQRQLEAKNRESIGRARHSGRLCRTCVPDHSKAHPQARCSCDPQLVCCATAEPPKTY